MASFGDIYNRLQYFSQHIDKQSFEDKKDISFPELTHLLKAISHVNVEGVDLEIRHRIIDILGDIDRKISGKLAISTKKIDSLHLQIIQTKNDLLKQSVDLQIAYFSTSACKDHSGVFDPDIKSLIRAQIPFIVSKSLMVGTDRVSVMSKGCKLRTERDFGKSFNDANWQAYVHGDAESDEEMVFFVPRSLFPLKSGKERLKALDLKTDGTVRGISLREAFSGPSGDPDFRLFTGFFDKDAKKSKVFFVAGHGAVGQPVGMKKKHYQEFLKFCEKQKCRGVYMTSCYSGGESTLLLKEQTPSFPIIAQSVGDWPSSSSPFFSQVGEEVVSFTKLIENPNEQNFVSFQRFATKYNLRGENTPQLYLPQSKKSFFGSRTIASEIGERITLLTTLKQEISSTSQGKKTFTVENKEELLVHPSIVQMPVKHSKKDPCYRSAFPGQVHHYFEKIKLCHSADLWIKRMRLKYSTSGSYLVGVRKAFFIQSLESPQGDSPEALKGLALICHPNGKFFACYQQNGKCYTYHDESPQEITPFQYALKCQEIAEKTSPSEFAMSAASGGQQDEVQFLKTLESKGFFQAGEISTSQLNKWTDQQLLDLFDSLPNTQDQEGLVIYLITKNKENLAQELLEKRKLSVNSRDLDGNPLINIAIEMNQNKLVRYLLSKDVDLNVSDIQTGFSPLHVATIHGFDYIVEDLLKVEGIQLDTRNKKKDTPLSYKYIRSSTADLLLKYGANPYEKCKFRGVKMTAFVKHCMTNQYDTVEVFIKNGVNPNIGSPLPLHAAIYHNNIRMVNLLMLHGANPFLEPDEGPIPIFECVRSGSPKMLTEMLTDPQSDFTMTSDGDLLVTYALVRGNDAILSLLREKGAKLSDSMAPWMEKDEFIFNEILNTTMFDIFRNHIDDKEYIQIIYSIMKSENPLSAEKFLKLIDYLKYEWSRIPSF